MARLAWGPLPRRELIAILGVALVLGPVLWVYWAASPAPGPQPHLTGRILKLTVRPDSKWVPANAVIDVELPGGKRTTLFAAYAKVSRCKLGDTIGISQTPNKAGGMTMSVDPGSCRN